MNKSNEYVKDLPVSERPYEKCERYGVNALSDAELLAVILRTGTHQRRVGELSLAVLGMCGADRSIGHLSNLSLEELKRIDGIGRVKAITLLCLCEFSKRMWRQKFERQISLSKSSEAAGYYMEELRYSDIENVYVMMLNTKNVMISDFHMTMGTVDSAPVSAREILQKALLSGAVNIILVHNHPSGDPTPSREDIGVTEKLREACALIGITLLDSIIIGDGVYFSFKERELLS